jgi:hypothetical protein
MTAEAKWRSLAALQQERQVEIVDLPIEPPFPQSAEPPDTINDTGRAAVELLKRWRANSNDDGAAVSTLLAVYGLNSSIGRMVVKWPGDPLPVHIWLAELAYENGARLADMGEKTPVTLRSQAAVEMIRWRIEHHQKKLKPMGFQTLAALLGYWRERREILHVLRTVLRGNNRRRIGMMHRTVEGLVLRLEDDPVRIMRRWAIGGSRDGK